jgi:hypothetical protein
MKSLKESILSSTKTGSTGIIKNWCDKYIGEGRYTLTTDNKVAGEKNYGGVYIYPEKIGDELIPEYIKFAEGISYLSMPSHAFNSLKKDQLPKEVGNLSIKMTDTHLKSFEISVKTSFSISNNSKYDKPIKSFDDIYINFLPEKDYVETKINLYDSEFDVNNLKKLHITTQNNNPKLILNDSSKAAKQINKEYLKICRETKNDLGYVNRNKRFSDYMNNLLSNAKDLKCVYIKYNVFFYKDSFNTWIKEKY